MTRIAHRESPLLSGILALWPFFVIVIFSVLLGTRLDVDSYYMISEGRRIIELGAVPSLASFSMYPDVGIVVQQWAYCVIEYLCSLAYGNWGLYILLIAQCTLLYLAAYKLLSRSSPVSFLAKGAALICCMFGNAYFYSLRPENLTLTLILLEIMSLCAYSDTGRKRFLIFPPLLTALEANLHGSMWPFHVLAFLAFLVPCFKLPGRVRISVPVVLSLLLTCAAPFANPYGTDGALYIFRSMGVFGYIRILEQQRASFMSPVDVFGLALIIASVLLIAKKCRFKSYEIWLSLGFTFVGLMNVHASMFYVISSAIIFAAALRMVRSPSAPDRLAALSSALIIIGMAMAACLSLGWLASYVMPHFTEGSAPSELAIADYLKSDKSRGAVLNVFDIGSYLEYRGIDRLFTDTRPELMLKSVNGSYDIARDMEYLNSGYDFEGNFAKTYCNIDGYLDKMGVSHIIFGKSCTSMFAFLYGYISMSEGWEKVVFDADDGDAFSYVVYRKASDGDNI